MRYRSTRGGATGVQFVDVLLQGMAPDGGLYVPESYPTLQFGSMGNGDYTRTATEVMWPFVEENYEREEFAEMVSEAYAEFDHPQIAPLRELNPAAGEWLLELFWGPSLAFKDIALQLLGRLLEHELSRRSTTATLIGATSGDTGSAAIEAVRGRAGIELFMLHPEGRVSTIQRLQMTTVDEPNIHNIAIEGTFDDCQDLVKAMFAGEAFRARYRLGTVNSINWARVMAQVVYYVSSARALGAPEQAVAFSVPTGNFGNIYAGHVARSMGVPIDQLILATNVNDILSRAYDSGVVEVHQVVASQSPAMDIQVSSNFERLLFELFDRDGSQTAAFLEEFRSTGRAALSGPVHGRFRQLFDAGRLTDSETRNVISEVYKESGLVIDPHTAVGVGVGRERRSDPSVPLVMLACAHPAKFPDTVVGALGEPPITPHRLAGLAGLAEYVEVLPNSLDAVQEHIAARALSK